MTPPFLKLFLMHTGIIQTYKFLYQPNGGVRGLTLAFQKYEHVLGSSSLKVKSIQIAEVLGF
jgi:hypothetical protein